MKPFVSTRKNKGFTLMELLIVVAIIAVLVAVAIPTFTGKLERSREATDAANIRSKYAEMMTDVILEDYQGNDKYQVQGEQQQADWQTDSLKTTLPMTQDNYPTVKGTASVYYVETSTGGVAHVTWDDPPASTSTDSGNTGGGGNGTTPIVDPVIPDGGGDDSGNGSGSGSGDSSGDNGAGSSGNDDSGSSSQTVSAAAEGNKWVKPTDNETLDLVQGNVYWYDTNNDGVFNDPDETYVYVAGENTTITAQVAQYTDCSPKGAWAGRYMKSTGVTYSSSNVVQGGNNDGQLLGPINKGDLYQVEDSDGVVRNFICIGNSDSYRSVPNQGNNYSDSAWVQINIPTQSLPHNIA